MTPEAYAGWPLAVDLDGTLIHGDVSVSATRSWAAQRPLQALRAAPALLRKRAHFKQRLAQAAAVPSVRYRADFLAWLRAQKAAGRALHLITGADQRFADAIAGPLDLFASIEGSDGVVNLIGEAKARRLATRFPRGFSYAGDSRKDLAVFAAAKSIVLVGASLSVRVAARALGVPVEAEFD